MKFTLSWLKEHLDTTASLGEIRDTLTMLGLEVEGITNPAETLKGFVVGYVVEAVQHPNADRLRVCKVDTGAGVVQVVCGAPNARTGMKGIFAPSRQHHPGHRPAAQGEQDPRRGQQRHALLLARAASWATTIAASSTCRPRPRPARRRPRRSASTIR